MRRLTLAAVAAVALSASVLAQGSAVHTQTIRQVLLDHLTPGEQDLLARALTRVADGGHSPPVLSPTVQEDSWPSPPHSA